MSERAGPLTPHYRPVWRVAAAGLVLTALASGAVYEWERRDAVEHAERDFKAAARDRQQTMRESVRLDVGVVQAARSLFQASQWVSRGEFRTFVTRLFRERPSIQAVEWVPRVRAERRDAFVAAARATHPEFRITAFGDDGALVPAPEKPEYYPVYFLEPRAGNETALGLDLSSGPAQAALERARDTGRLALSRAHRLVQDPEGALGVLAVAPVYRETVQPATVSQRRERLTGFVVGVLAIEQMVEGALRALEPRGLDLWLYDSGDRGARARLLYWHPSRLAPPEPGAAPRRPGHAAFLHEEPLRIGGRTLRLVAAPVAGAFRPRVPSVHWAVLGGGLLITALLAAYLHTLARHAALHERSAQQLARLNRAHTLLSACNQALVRATDEQALLDTFCRNAVEIGGYRMAWVGFAEHDEAKRVRPVAWAGHEEGFTQKLSVTWSEDSERGWGPMARAIREGRTVIVRDIGSEPAVAWARAEATARGYVSVIALPLPGNGERVGALVMYSTALDAFDPGEAAVLEELAEDLAYGIRSLRTRAEYKQAEAGLRLRDRAIESSLDGVLITDAAAPGHPIVYVNPAFTRITGYGRDEVTGQSPEFLYARDPDQAGLEEIRAAVRGQREGSALVRSYRKDGTLFWNELHVAPVRGEAGAVTHFVSIINDATERMRYQQELEHQANYDALTGLANRNLLQDRLNQAVRHAARRGSMTGVLVLDLDQFKKVNDSLGRECGDRLLKTVGERLHGCIQAGDTVARQSGDEFVLVFPDVVDADELAATAHRLLEAVAHPVELDGHDVVTTASIGVSIFPRDGQHPERLLRNADAAMHRAKERGPGVLRFYHRAMNERALGRLTLERSLRRALEREEFVLHYQPQVDVRSGCTIGMEALVRWQSPDGMVPPAKFIPLAEHTGLILPLGEWVLRAACRQNRAWQEAGLAPIRVGVNVSARQFRQRSFPDRVERALYEAGLEPRFLEIELTESMMMDDPERVIEVLKRLKELGVALALDDFGTGYSSLSYLKRFPIDRIKIDQTFVLGMLGDPDDSTITRTVIAMVHAMRLRVIAEGVETGEHLRYLLKHSCDEAQGYGISHPLPVADAERFLRDPPDLFRLVSRGEVGRA